MKKILDKIQYWLSAPLTLWIQPDHEELVIAWKEITDQEPKDVEAVMIQEFKDYFGQRPLANLQG